MTSFVLDNIDWLGVPFTSPASSFESSPTHNPVRVLDYACGPGTVTNALSNHATEYVGIDISEGMLDAYNTRFTKDASPSQKFTARGVVGNLIEEAPPEHLSGPEFFNFDLAVVGAGFHHFDNVQLATNRLAERLKPGGVLAIIDFIAWEAEGDEHKHQIAHNGFTEEGVKKMFGTAGLVDVGIIVDDKEWKIKDWTRTGFMAKGKKPVESTREADGKDYR